MKKIFVVFCIITSIASQTFAQTAPAGEEKTKVGPRKQLATIVFAGLGGAVLGLSTLSFYGRPQEHLSNIAIGFAVGVIIGTAYMTYNTAKSPPTYSALFPEPTTNQRKNDIQPLRLSANLFTYQF